MWVNISNSTSSKRCLPAVTMPVVVTTVHAHSDAPPEVMVCLQADHLAQRVRFMTATLRQVETQDEQLKKDIAVVRRCGLLWVLPASASFWLQLWAPPECDELRVVAATACSVASGCL